LIYLKEGNIPLNLCTDDDISQQENNTYQLTFKYPVSDEKWSLLQNEVHLLADDLSGEQEFVIIDVQKGHGYITVYANQVATLLNGYSIRKINVDRANGFTVMNKLVEGLKRECPFTFFSDISELHTLNIENVSVIDALLKGQHSIVGQWGGDLVRDKYSVRLLKNGGIENQSLFMYKKNLSEYKESTTTKSLKTRIHFRKVITASGEGEKDKVLEATVDSPLVDKYKHIYEDDMEVQDQDVKTIEDLKEYGKKYFQSSLCDLPDESLEIDVLGHAEQPVKLFDTVSIFYELYNVDIRKKITSYNYSPMSKKLKKIGFGKISRSLGDAIGKIVDDIVKDKIASHDAEYEAKVQKLVDNANAEYDKQSKKLENKVTDGIEQAKAQAEVVKAEISAQITGRFNDFNFRIETELDNQSSKISEAKKQAEAAFNQIWDVRFTADKAFEKAQQASTQALYAIDNNDKIKSELADFKKSAQKSQTTLSEEINAFKEQYGTKLNEVVNTTDGIAIKIAEIKTYVDNDGNRTDELKRYVRDETSTNITSIREELSTNYINKATYNENARTVERRFEALTSEQDAKLSTYKQGIDGRFTEITSLLNGKVNRSDFQRVQENSALYERILGTSESDIPNKMSRLIMSSQIFQTEVGKYVTDDNNLIVNSMSMSTNTLVGNNNPKASVSVSDGIFTIKAQGLTGYNWSGFTLPIYVKKIYHGETYTLGFKYRIREYPDSSFAFNVKNHGLNKILLSSDIGKNRPPLNEWQEFQKTFTVQEDFAFGEDYNYPFYIYLAKNGWIEFKEPILVRGSNTGPYKPSQFDDAFAKTRSLESQMNSKIGEVSEETAIVKQLAYTAQNRAEQANGISQIAKEKAEDAQTKAIQVAEQARQAQATAEATRTQVTQLAGSYAIQNLNSAGDLISGINLGASGLNRITGKATHITGDTLIDNAVIKSAMVDKLKTGNFESGSVTTQIIASNAVTADKLLVDSAMINKLVSNQAFIRELASQRAFITQLTSVGISANDIRGGRLTANSGVSIFDLDNGRLSLYDNFTGVFRDQTNASSQGLFFRNDNVTINGRRYINSKAIIGADRRDNDIRNHWNQGGFNGMIVDTIKGVGTGDHDNADKVTFVGDRFNFTHSYDYDKATGSDPYGWRITTWGGTTIAPFGTNGRNTNIQAGDFLLINKGNNGVWLRQALRTLRTALQHFVNAGFATDDFTPQNGKSMRTALHSSIRNAVANSLRDFDKFGI
jgi:phage minor structural protein